MLSHGWLVNYCTTFALLLQKNQDAIRRGETNLGLLTSSIDLVISYEHADRLSPHIKTLCKAAKTSIYTTESDLSKTAESECALHFCLLPILAGSMIRSWSNIREKQPFFCLIVDYSRPLKYMMDATHKVTTNKLPRCHEMSTPRSCLCYYKLSISWYPCSLKYCKTAESSDNMPAYYKCGINTCGLTRLYMFSVSSHTKCWWEAFQPFRKESSS